MSKHRLMALLLGLLPGLLLGLLLGLSLLGGCAAPGALVLHNVGSADPARVGSFVNATPAQASQGLRISRNGQGLAVDIGMPLMRGDVVESLDNTIAVIHFPDGHRATLLPGTRVRLGSITVLFGKLWVQAVEAVDAIKAMQDRFKVKTEYVTAGVEGTTFWVQADRADNVRFGVVDGRISLSSAAGLWPAVPVLPNEEASVQRDHPPVKVQRKGDEVDAIVRLMGSGIRLAPRAPPRPATPVPR